MRVGTLIAGGGVAGLACARELHDRGRSYLLVERETDPGGFCRSIECRGFTFDYTGHFLHFGNPETRRRVLGLSPGLLKPRLRRAAVYSRGVFSEYPYQDNSAGLPAETALENVSGCLEAILRRREGIAGESGNFREWCLSTFGKGISRNFLFPYNAKFWKTPLCKLTTRWMGRFVPRPDAVRVASGAMSRKVSNAGYNAVFYYPDKGGISVLPALLARGVPGLFHPVALTGVDLSHGTALLSTGLQVRFDRLVSSLPLPFLIRMARGVPGRIRRAAARLKATSIYNINFGLKRRKVLPYNWVYFPEPGFGFHRAGSVSECVPGVAPRGCSTLYLEYSYRGVPPDRRKLGREAVRDLLKLGWIGSVRDIAVRVDLHLPRAYVLYDEQREEIVGELLGFLGSKNVFSVGRYGRWEYGTMESAIEQGWEAART